MMRYREITPSGVVTTLAGSFDDPRGVAVDSAGNVYVADAGNDEIRKITPSGVVTTLAGSAGQTGSSDGTGSAARFNGPNGVAVDSAGNVYVADTGNDEIRKITPSGVVTTLAGSAGQAGSSDGTGSAARFGSPGGVAVDSAGNVYVADENNDEIRKITPSGVVTTLAGSAGQGGSSDGAGSAARFNYPVAWRWTARATSTWPISAMGRSARSPHLAWSPRWSAGNGSSDGTGSAARFDDPEGVAVDSAGNVYVADTCNEEIREISGTVVSGDTAAFSETYDTPTAGTGKTLTPAGSVSDGNGGNNYAVTFAVNTTGVILSAITTTTAVSTSQASVVYGTAVTFAATVSAGSGTTAPTAGSVDFFDTTTNHEPGTRHLRQQYGHGLHLDLGDRREDLQRHRRRHHHRHLYGRHGLRRQQRHDDPDGHGAADHGHRGHQHQGLRRHDLLDGHADDHRRQPGQRRHGGLHRDLRHPQRGHGQDAHRGRLRQRRQQRQQLRGDLRAPTPPARSRRGRSRSPRPPAPRSTTARRPRRPRRRSPRQPGSGDTAAFTETFDTRNVGTGKTLTPAGSVNDGNGGNNYAVTFAANTTGQITPLAITVTAATSTKAYDGTTSSTATPTITAGIPRRSHHPGWLRWASRFQRWHRQRGKI